MTLLLCLVLGVSGSLLLGVVQRSGRVVLVSLANVKLLLLIFRSESMSQHLSI